MPGGGRRPLAWWWWWWWGWARVICVLHKHPPPAPAPLPPRVWSTSRDAPRWGGVVGEGGGAGGRSATATRTSSPRVYTPRRRARWCGRAAGPASAPATHLARPPMCRVANGRAGRALALWRPAFQLSRAQGRLHPPATHPTKLPRRQPPAVRMHAQPALPACWQHNALRFPPEALCQQRAAALQNAGFPVRRAVQILQYSPVGHGGTPTRAGRLAAPRCAGRRPGLPRSARLQLQAALTQTGRRPGRPWRRRVAGHPKEAAPCSALLTPQAQLLGLRVDALMCKRAAPQAWRAARAALELQAVVWGLMAGPRAVQPAAASSSRVAPAGGGSGCVHACLDTENPAAGPRRFPMMGPLPA
jgi:hypothetical protein